jgi:hypothetical protein
MPTLPTVKAVVTMVLSRYGRPVEILRKVSVKDPVAGTVTKTTTEVPAFAYFDNFKKSNTPEGFAVEAQDAAVIIDTEVTKQDQIRRPRGASGTVWNVVEVQPLEFEDGEAAWLVQARR